MSTKKNKRKTVSGGFTVVELIVSVGLFAFGFVAVSGAFLTILDSYQKVTATRLNVDNLTGSLESMIRGAKTGTIFHCGETYPLTDPRDCPGGDTFFSFMNPNIPRPFGTATDLAIAYKLVPCGTGDPYCGRIQRSDDGGSNWYPVTVAPPELTINEFRFYVVGSTPFRVSDGAGANVVQPQVMVVIKGTVGVKDKIKTPFNIQTMITQRRIDVE